MPIVYAGGRYHVAVGSVGAAVLFLKYGAVRELQTEYAHALPLFAAGSVG